VVEQVPHMPKRAERHGNEKNVSLGRRIRRAAFEIVIILVSAAVISTLLRFFVIQVYSIPSGSMTNTLEVGDRIAVNRLPVLGKQVERGDVIVFSDDNGWLPDDGSTPEIWKKAGEFLGIFPANGEEVLVKRVIGLGGDTVECCDASGKILVNGVAIDEPYLKPGVTPSDQEFAVTVPEGTLWVMGDNRSGSADSRSHLGQGNSSFISDDAVLGKVWGVVWPLSHWSGVGSESTFDNVPESGN